MEFYSSEENTISGQNSRKFAELRKSRKIEERLQSQLALESA